LDSDKRLPGQRLATASDAIKETQLKIDSANSQEAWREETKDNDDYEVTQMSKQLDTLYRSAPSPRPFGISPGTILLSYP
jgi:hypothetical protein